MKRLLIKILLLAAAGCAAKGDGTSLEILSVPAPDANTCNRSPEPQFIALRDSYDPSLSDGYSLDLIVQNNMAKAEQDPAQGFVDTDNLRPNAHDATIQGLDVCWYFANQAPASTFGSFAEGRPPPLECDKLPSDQHDQRRFVVASGSIEAGGGKGLTGAMVLRHGDLRAAGIYGANFDPGAIPVIGCVPGDLNDDGDATELGEDCAHYSNALDQSSPAWGNYLTVADGDLVLQLRAVAQLQNGTTVHSNWIVFPITVSVGGFVNPCGDLVAGRCGGDICAPVTCTPGATCPDFSVCPANGYCKFGEPCPRATKLCADGTVCSPESFALKGSVFDSSASCLTWQGHGTRACRAFDGCAP